MKRSINKKLCAGAAFAILSSAIPTMVFAGEQHDYLADPSIKHDLNEFSMSEEFSEDIKKANEKMEKAKKMAALKKGMNHIEYLKTVYDPADVEDAIGIAGTESLGPLLKTLNNLEVQRQISKLNNILYLQGENDYGGLWWDNATQQLHINVPQKASLELKSEVHALSEKLPGQVFYQETRYSHADLVQARQEVVTAIGSHSDAGFLASIDVENARINVRLEKGQLQDLLQTMPVESINQNFVTTNADEQRASVTDFVKLNQGRTSSKFADIEVSISELKSSNFGPRANFVSGKEGITAKDGPCTFGWNYTNQAGEQRASTASHCTSTMKYTPPDAPRMDAQALTVGAFGGEAHGPERWHYGRSKLDIMFISAHNYYPGEDDYRPFFQYAAGNNQRELREVATKADVFKGMQLCKFGSTTNRTCGEVVVVDMEFCLPTLCGRKPEVHLPNNVVAISNFTSNFSEGGDSGGNIYGAYKAYGNLNWGINTCELPGQQSFKCDPYIEAGMMTLVAEVYKQMDVTVNGTGPWIVLTRDSDPSLCTNSGLVVNRVTRHAITCKLPTPPFPSVAPASNGGAPGAPAMNNSSIGGGGYGSIQSGSIYTTGVVYGGKTYGGALAGTDRGNGTAYPRASVVSQSNGTCHVNWCSVVEPSIRHVTPTGVEIGFKWKERLNSPMSCSALNALDTVVLEYANNVADHALYKCTTLREYVGGTPAE